MTDRIEENKKAQAEWLEVLERIKKKNGDIEDLDLKPGDVKYLYVVIHGEYNQEITKGIFLHKEERDCFNMTWYSFSLFEDGTPIRSVSRYHIFDTKEEVEAYVKAVEEKEAIEFEKNKRWLESDEYKERKRQAEEKWGFKFDD
jgi:hypothetical protein